MAELHKILANIKTALESRAEERRNSHPEPDLVPEAPAAHRTELASRFGRELEAVGGKFLGIFSPAGALARIVALTREIGASTAAIGDGVVSDVRSIAAAIESANIRLIRTESPRDEQERLLTRERLARCDLGIAEAHFAIASTGTLAVVTTEHRPSSLTLLPPASLIIIRIDRIMADLAAVLEALGPEVIGRDRLSLITGPSRTADIEKRIVLGVHGPKALYALVIWPENDREPAAR
ncbi:MAG TPA: lactate utilization protein [Candidatus Binataceae bacterium]